MKIQLLADHTALLLDDRRGTVSIEPACEGVLELEGEKFPLRTGSPVPRNPELIGHVRVVFTPTGGVRHVGINPHMKDGVPVSHIDYTAAYLPMRLKIDELERQVDKLARAVHTLETDRKKNALGFLHHNTKNKEK